MTRIIPFVLVFLCLTTTLQAQIGWVQMHPYPDGTSVTKENLQSVHFLDSLHGFVAARYGVLETSDGGVTWAYRDFDIDQSQTDGLKSITFADNQHGWVVGLDGLHFRTSDGGATWNPRKFKKEYDLQKVFFLNEDIGWAVGDSSSWPGNRPGKGLILKTTDGGYGWSRITFPPSTPLGQWIYWYDIQFVDETTGFVVGASGEIAKSTDGGESWVLLPKFSNDKYALHFLDAQHGFVTGCCGWLYETKDGGVSWRLVDRPVMLVEFDLHFVNEVVGYSSGGIDPYIQKTTDGGVTWFKQIIPPLVGYPDFHAMHFINADHGWAVGEAGTILRTTDGGGVLASGVVPVPVNITMSVSPQPIMSGQQSTIQVSVPTTGIVSLHVYDLLGRLVQTVHEGQLTDGQHRVDLHMDNTKPGIYFIRMTTDEQQITRKFLIQ